MTQAAHVQYVNAPNGVAHTVDTVRRMAQLATDGSHTYAIRSLATKITHDVPSRDKRGELAAIYRWVRDHIRYRLDPRGLEWIQAPDRTVIEQAGDCDDMAILIAALAQSLGHAARFRTVGATANRQTHVHAQVNDGEKWIDLDPVLEPQQPTTAPRADLGAFGRRAPGAERLYTERGQPMSGTGKNGIRLWQPTNFETTPQQRPRIVPIYRSKGSAGRPVPIRTNMWNNAYDPGDLAGGLGALGMNWLKAIGSVAKVAGAIGVPGASALSMGIDVGSKLIPVGRRAATPPPGAAPVIAGGATAPRDPMAPAPSGGAATAAAFPTVAAMNAMASQNRQSTAAILSLATGQQRARHQTAAREQHARHRAAGVAPTPQRKPKRRQVWNPLTRKWTIYQERPAGALAGFRPSITFAMGAIDPSTFTPYTALNESQARARELAPQLAASVRARGFNYSRPLAIEFQKAAMLAPDGFYGGAAAGAVRYFTGTAPPRALFNPIAEKPYNAPTASVGPPPTNGGGAIAITFDTPPATSPRPTVSSVPNYSPAIMSVAPAPSYTPSNPINVQPQSMTRRDLAASAVLTIERAIAATGSPPAGAVPGIGAYQQAAGIVPADSKWGPLTRASAAADLGVSADQLPRSAYDAGRPRRPRRASAPTTPTTPTYDPIAVVNRDPGLPSFPGTPEQPATPSEPSTPTTAPKNNTAALLFVAYLVTRRHRNGRR